MPGCTFYQVLCRLTEARTCGGFREPTKGLIKGTRGQ